MQRLISASYGLDVLLLLLFQFAGTIPLRVPVAYGCVAIVVCSSFFLVLGSTWPDRRRDQNLTGFQMPVAAAVQLAFVLLAPQVGFVFLTILFIVFAFAALRLDVKEATFAGLRWRPAWPRSCGRWVQNTGRGRVILAG